MPACASASCRRWATCMPGIIRWSRWRAGTPTGWFASVFVNPTQFGSPFLALSAHPRRDAGLQAAAGCDAPWLPSVETMYPLRPGSAACEGAGARRQRGAGRRAIGRATSMAWARGRIACSTGWPSMSRRSGAQDTSNCGDPHHGPRPRVPRSTCVAGDISAKANGLAMSSRNQYPRRKSALLPPVIHRTLLAMRRHPRRHAARTGPGQ